MKKSTIDTEIIWKKINGSLTRDEEVLFDQWFEEKEEHQVYFEKASKYFISGSAYEMESIDIQSEWNKVEQEFGESKKKVDFNWRRAMAVAAVLIFTVAGYLISDKFMKNDQPAMTEIVIEPGKSVATLTLDNGSTYELTGETDLNIQTEGARVKSEGSSVSYEIQAAERSASSEEIAYNTLEIPRGGEFFVELSDGTKVWINADSRLKYPVRFIGDERNVELIGEAYFEVAHNATKPFIVTSGVQQIEVLGTEFNITSYENDDIIITTLVEGEVSVRRSYGEQNETRLLPNQQSILTKSSGEIISQDVDPNQYIAWKTGRFYFENNSLTDIMKVLSRWYDIDVFFDNTEKATLQFSGGFERYENFEKVKLILESTEEVKFLTKENTVIIK